MYCLLLINYLPINLKYFKQGKPYVLPCVRQAEQELTNAHLDKEYAAISGLN